MPGSNNDRLLVINGDRKISGRGRSTSAAPDDAAALLLAVAATPIAGPAINIASFRSYANLRGVRILPGELWSWKEIDSLKNLAHGHMLLEALTRIIDCLSRSALLLDENGRMIPEKDYRYQMQVWVELYAPFPRATITIEHTPQDSYESHLVEQLHYYPFEEPSMHETSSIDFSQQRGFGMLTLWSLASLFRDSSHTK